MGVTLHKSMNSNLKTESGNWNFLVNVESPSLNDTSTPFGILLNTPLNAFVNPFGTLCDLNNPRYTMALTLQGPWAALGP